MSSLTAATIIQNAAESRNSIALVTFSLPIVQLRNYTNYRNFIKPDI